MHAIAWFLVGFGAGVGSTAIVLASLAYLAASDRSLRSFKQRPVEFKLAEDQDPINKPRAPGETRISKIDFARRTPVRRLVRDYRAPVADDIESS